MASISYQIKREIFSFIWPKRKGLLFMKSEKGKKKNKNKKINKQNPKKPLLCSKHLARGMWVIKSNGLSSTCPQEA